jgi:hypothetical protein
VVLSVGVIDGRADEDRLRLVRTQALFRDVNEQIRRLASEHELVDLDLICECSDDACAERLAVPVDEYERVRAVSARFFVQRGHEIPEIERTVGEHDGFIIVEKLGEAAEIAEELDPHDRGVER